LRAQVEKLLRYHDEAGDFIGSPAAAASPELLAEDPDALIGEHLGSYRIDSVLGVGGMGVVYCAYDERLGRKVGLKLLPRALVTDAAQLARLKLEARTASALNHPNIVTVHEIGHVDTTHYIAIEFIEGVTLRERINRGAVPPDEALEIMTQVASALCVAHRAGIVHRDIKPENIMIRPDGYVKVLDFGIAKSTQANLQTVLEVTAWQTNPRTQRGVVIGTMRYMSPEQARGQAVDARSDVWSIGVVLYEMLTARPPFEGATPDDVRTAVCEREPIPLDATIPAPLREVVGKCLEKNPTERFRSGEELLAELRRTSGKHLTKPHPWQWAALAAIVIAVVSLILLVRGPSPKEKAIGEAPNESSRKSIAVLPFADLSPERDQQYFSDGMAEEILNALAHVKDLKVAGRSSSFSFRGKDADLRAIGTALGVAHVLEGSVRKQGDKVRITAQLIQVSDGFHLWSQTYDGDQRDVFSLQERIARAITDQLDAVLNGEQKSRLVKTATTSSEAYALFLEATAVFNRRDGAHFRDAIAQLKEAVRLDPQFARAHARLASLASIAPQYDVQLDDNPGDVLAHEARLASELDPSLAEPHAAVGQTLFTQRRFSEARAAYARALELDPDDATANLWLGTLLCSTGYTKSAAEVLDRLLTRDPMLPNALLWRGWTHLHLGEIDEAERSIRHAADAGLNFVGLAFAHVARARGDNAAVVDWLGRGIETFVSDLPAGTSRLIANASVDDAQRAEAIAAIDRYLAARPPYLSGAIPLALIWLGQPDRALAVAEEKPTRNDTVLLASLWTAAGREARAAPQFATFARRTGLAEFWDRTGPPDLCRRAESGAYVCNEVATARPLAARNESMRPTGVAINANGNIYVADFPNHTICEITAEGAVKDFAGTRGIAGNADGVANVARFDNPADIATGPDGSLYVADCNNHAIRKITPAGVVSTFAGQTHQAGHEDGPASSATFRYPTGLAVDRAGNVYVADIGNNLIRKITPDGMVNTLAGVAGEAGSNDGIGTQARFNQAHGVGVDLAGNVYAADFGNHTIRKITPDGTVTTIGGQAGTPGSNDGIGTAAHFCAPYSVAADRYGNVIVADTSNHTIRKIAPDGTVTTIAGVAGNVGNTDGAGNVARFAIPAAVKPDSSGSIYVADFGNYAVRKVTPEGDVTTVAPLAGNQGRRAP
jgi:serine/threonine protein kinase/tetratricopeptide (TPR) repeat protein/sugar lactone lactonase YvrE